MPFGSPAAWGAIDAILGTPCRHCGKRGAEWRAEVDPVHVISCDIVKKLSDICSCGASPAYGYWCNTTCHANWGTNRPVKK